MAECRRAVHLAQPFHLVPPAPSQYFLRCQRPPQLRILSNLWTPLLLASFPNLLELLRRCHHYRSPKDCGEGHCLSLLPTNSGAR